MSNEVHRIVGSAHICNFIVKHRVVYKCLTYVSQLRTSVYSPSGIRSFDIFDVRGVNDVLLM